MPSILGTNAIELTPANEPIIFILANNVANAVQVSADIYINGSATAIGSVYSDKRTLLFGGFYEFSIDVSAPIRDYLSHKLNAYGTGGDIVDNLAQARINITFFEWRIVGGLLTQDAVNVDFSDTFVALNAVRQYNELRTLERNLFGSGTTENLALSNRPQLPKSVKMRLDESEYLGIYADSSTHYAVLCYDSTGTLFRAGIRTLSAFTTHGGIRTNATRQIGVGAANINNTTFTSWFGGMTAPNIDDQVLFYFVYWGIPVTPFGIELFQAHNGMKYSVGKSCADQLKRFHFMNSFGEFDSISFPKFTKLQREGTPDRYERPLIYSGTTPPGYSARGLSILRSDAEQSFEIESFAMSEEEIKWLSEMLSPEVYIEDVDYLGNIINVPIVLDKNKIDLVDDLDTGFSIMKIQGSYGRMIESQGT